MGIRFDLNTVNWLAYIIEPKEGIPIDFEDWEVRESFHLFFKGLSKQYMSTINNELYIKRLSSAVLKYFTDTKDIINRNSIPSIIRDIRNEFSNRPWTALIIPSGENIDIDNYLCSENYLRELVDIQPEDSGLILQLDSPPRKEFTLLNVFPAFRVALNESNKWPGILLWSRSGDSVFLPFELSKKKSIIENSHWIFRRLANSIGIDLALLKEHYYDKFSKLRKHAKQIVHLLHLSDLHIGSKDANIRLPRVIQLIENILGELDDSIRIIPIFSGDIMESPDNACLDGVRSFLNHISSLFSEKPIVVLGNHDVRRKGFLSENSRKALQINQTQMVWFEDEKLGIACFNSVIEGKLARGYIGDRQFIDLGNEIDRKRKWKDYLLISVLHHHPISVETPSWYAQKLYERIFQAGFEKTQELRDANNFIKFIESRHFEMVLHGHKHIPHFTKTKGRNVPIIGCGSTSGKVATTDGSVYMSINIYSIDISSHKITARLLAERIPGGGLTQSKRHEFMYRS